MNQATSPTSYNEDSRKELHYDEHFFLSSFIFSNGDISEPIEEKFLSRQSWTQENTSKTEDEINISELIQRSNRLLSPQKVKEPIQHCFFLKRGRKRKEDADKHNMDHDKGQSKRPSKNRKDNIKSSLKTAFMSFAVSFFNVLIRIHFNGQQKRIFRKVAHHYTKDITVKYNQKMFFQTMKELLSQEVSRKNHCPEDMNEETCEFLMKTRSEAFKGVLEMSVANFYNTIFCGEPKEMEKCFRLDEVEITKEKRLPKFFKEICLAKADDAKYLALFKKEGEELVNYYVNAKPKKSRKTTI